MRGLNHGARKRHGFKWLYQVYLAPPGVALHALIRPVGKLIISIRK